MAKAKYTKQRIYRVYKILEEETDETHGLTVPEILSRLECDESEACRQTIYDDIALLSDMNIDIGKFRTGRLTYFYLKKRSFSFSEIKMIVDSVNSAKFLTADQARELISKIVKLVSVHQAKYLNRFVYIPDRMKVSPTDTLHNIDLIHEAIHMNKRLLFRYMDTDWKGKLDYKNKHTYEVSPAYVVISSEEYYFMGYSEHDKKIMNYRIDKMTEVRISDIPRNGIDANTPKLLSRYSKSMFGMFDGTPKTVTLECLKRKATIIYDRFEQSLMPFPSDDPEWFHVDVDVEESEQFYGWIFGLGDLVRIIGPDDVIGRFMAYTDKIRRSYLGSDSQNKENKKA